MVQRLKELCKKKGTNFKRLEKELGIGNGTIAKSAPTMRCDRLKMLADYFGVTMEYLMTGKEPERGEGAILIDAGSSTQDFNASFPALPSGGEGAAKKQRELILTDTEIRLVLAFRNLPGETKLFILNAMGIKGVDPETEDATSMAAVS